MATETTVTTFDQIINRHGRLITNILANVSLVEENASAGVTPQQFVDRVELAARCLKDSPLWPDDQFHVETAHRWLNYALDQGPGGRAALLDLADKRLRMVDAGWLT